MEHFDIIIVGQGIAGTVLSLAAQHRNLKVLGIDSNRRGASWAAGGLVHPLVFKRLTLAWPGIKAMELANKFYSQVSPQAWRNIPLIRRIGSLGEKKQWEEKILLPPFTEILKPIQESGDMDSPVTAISAPFGWGPLSIGGVLDPHKFFPLIHTQLEDQGALIHGWIDFENRKTHEDMKRGRLEVNNRIKQFDTLVLAPGIQHSPALNPYPRLPYYGVKGETLDILLPELNLHHGILGPTSLIPLGNNLVRVGSTYERNYPNDLPDPNKIREICENLHQVLPGFTPEDLISRVQFHRAGVRPAARDRRPYLGPFHSTFGETKKTKAKILSFNGLGTRGFLVAPTCAEILLDSITDGIPIPREYSPLRVKDPGDGFTLD